MPLNINFQQILLHMFNLVILAGGLYLLLYKPVADFMKKREDYYADLQSKALKTQQDADAALQTYQAKLADADEEIRQKSDAAAQETDAACRKQLERVRNEANKLMMDAKASAAVERKAMIESAQKDIAQMVVSATDKLLNQQDASHDQALYDSFLKAAQEDERHE